MTMNPIDRVEFDAARLLSDHPPRWRHANKELVYEIGGLSGFPVEGAIVFARWPAQPLPECIPSTSEFSVCSGPFAYSTPKESTVVDWHMNFSDPNLFVAYSLFLFAQDEIQVAEHPILGSIRESLMSQGIPAVTVDRHGSPTPVTITGVQRRCVIDTESNPAAGRPNGLYGFAFAQATEEQVRSAVRPLSPPTVSNILAMAAPARGQGTYRSDEIVTILTTAYTGFMAARMESVRLSQGVSRVVIHTGFWGCGAFGGNRKLMTILQSLAADMAGVDLVFWAFDVPGVQLAVSARQWLEQNRETSGMVGRLVDRMIAEEFLWGVSDGN